MTVTANPLNVAARLTLMARAAPDAPAVVEPLGYDRRGKRKYRCVTFRDLDEDSDRIAKGLAAMGATRGTRLALMVRPGIDFISLVFALFKAGTVAILIDPGMGRRNVIRCLEEAKPQGFVTIPAAHAVRVLLRRRFPEAKILVTVGRRWFWGGATLRGLRRRQTPAITIEPTCADDPAAIIFTSGGTGAPKGVLYTHGNFDCQVEQLHSHFQIEPGEIDLPAFPLFGLFNCALGATAVIPDMDPSHPAQVDPAKIVEAIHDWRVTQTFGSPAVWNRVGRYCEEHKVKLPTVRRVFSAGAPVPADVLDRMQRCIHPEGSVFTPYGATEALPVACISAAEVLGETAAKTRQGKGVCVGGKFSGIEWKVIRAVEGTIATMADAQPLPAGEIGELIVCGPVVTRAYVTRVEANALGKIADGAAFWHRMGDLGYLDAQDRFWMCGRLAHRLQTARGPMYTVCCEAIFNCHPAVFRSALVGVGPKGRQRPVIVLELRKESADIDRDVLLRRMRELALANPLTESIEDFLIHPSLPVDVRHNVKIAREQLAAWAAGEIKS